MSFSKYSQPFYLFNTLICLVYPLIRYVGLTSLYLKIKDTWGYERESQIIFGIGTLIIIKYLRHYTNLDKFLHETYFYFKCGTCFILFFISFKLLSWYLFSCFVIWVLFKPPHYKGPSNIKYISSVDQFHNQVMTKTKTVKNSDNYWFVVFYSNLSDDCIYVR